MKHTLTFRLRPDRADARGRAGVTVDAYWAKGGYGAGHHRLNAVATGVSCLVEHWQPERDRLALAEGRKARGGRLIYTAEPDANALNLQLDRISAAVEDVFRKAGLRDEVPTTAAVRAAIASARPASSRPVVPEAPPAPAAFVPTPTTPMPALLAYWKEINTGTLAAKTLARYDAVIEWLNRFHANATPADVDRLFLARYVNYLYDNGMHDGGIQNHFKWLREAFRLSGRHAAQGLLRRKFRAGRKPALLTQELQALMDAPLTEPALIEERDVFVFQTLLLLRDSDMQTLAPHHAVPLDLAAPHGRQLGLVVNHQLKTSEPVLGVMPPAAAAIWRKYDGRLPVRVGQDRNELIKRVATRAKLNREVVLTKFAGPNRTEVIKPLRMTLTTHIARHTGAALVMQGSNDADLREIALGHVNATYGPANIYAYAPLLLMAWEKALSGM